MRAPFGPRLPAWLGRVPAGPVVAVVAVLALWAMGTVPSAVGRVPHLVGLKADIATALAAEDGFRAETVFRNVGGVPGTVVGQHPSAGEFRARGSAVTVEVSRGARQVKVPDVKGMPVDEARRVLEEQRLRIGEAIYRVFPDREPGRVVETDPPAGRQVDEGTTVDLTAALG